MKCSAGLVDEDEDAISAPTDRAYWEKEKGTPKTVALMDRLFELVREEDPEVELKHNKFYVGLTKDGRADNYAQFRPQKASVVFEARLPRTDETDALLGESGHRNARIQHTVGPIPDPRHRERLQDAHRALQEIDQ